MTHLEKIYFLEKLARIKEAKPRVAATAKALKSKSLASLDLNKSRLKNKTIATGLVNQYENLFDSIARSEPTLRPAYQDLLDVIVPFAGRKNFVAWQDAVTPTIATGNSNAIREANAVLARSLDNYARKDPSLGMEVEKKLHALLSAKSDILNSPAHQADLKFLRDSFLYGNRPVYDRAVSEVPTSQNAAMIREMVESAANKGRRNKFYGNLGVGGAAATGTGAYMYNRENSKKKKTRFF